MEALIGEKIGMTQVFSKEDVKFATENIRAMWFMCATQFQMVAPTIPQIERVRLCDCYVDHIRNNYTSEQIMTNNSSSMGMTQEGYRRLSKELKNECNPKTKEDFN